MSITVVYEDRLAALAGEAGDAALWVAAPELARALGWEVKPEGLCRGSLCVPLPPGRRTEFVRADGAVNVAGLARHRGQAAVHDAERTVWVFGPGGMIASGRSAVAPDFTLPDLDGRRHTLSAFRGKKVLLDSWASW